MRYRTGETARAAQLFETGRTVNVTVLNLGTDALVSTTAGVASESAQISGLYIWSTSDLVTPPASYTELLVLFEDATSGLQKASKLVVRGYPDNIDAAVSSRAAPGDAMDLVANALDATAIASGAITAAKFAAGAITASAIATDAIGSDELAASAVTEINSAVLAAIAALNNLAIVDVQTALTGQGYTVARAALIDNLDQALSTTETNVLAAITALNNISVADLLAAALTSGDTVNEALSRLDNIDTDVSGTNTLVTALDSLIRGGRDIDFVGNDALGWQRIERNAAGAEVERYNLFDEDGNRITGTVTAFLVAQHMIASEVKL